MHLGIAHHLGWAVAVTATVDHEVVDRRRIELVGPGLPTAPIHHEGGAHPLHRSGPDLSDEELGELVARVRASATETTAAALDALAASLPAAISSISIPAWDTGLPTDIATLRRAPHESRADSVMYREVLAELADERGWAVLHFDAGRVEAEAEALVGDAAHEILHGPRARLGPPWTKDHRRALAATIVASRTSRP